MVAAARTFRLFVSSTFEDMAAEREALHQRVFPELDRLCRQRGARFQAVDLRWGVSEQAMRDRRTMPICLEEIARCQRITPRPNFLALLGNRYGWRPLPSQIVAGEFGRLLRQLTSEDREVLERWYERDDNAIPARWCLRPGAWALAAGLDVGAEETQLRRVLDVAATRAGVRHSALAALVGSATEQEITLGVFDAPKIEGSAFCFVREITGLPDDGRAEKLVDLDGGAVDRTAQARLADLKRRLEDHLDKGYRLLPVDWKDWTSDGPPEWYLHQLCRDVRDRLASVIVQETAPRPGPDPDPHDQEIAAHACAVRDLVWRFHGRGAILDQIRDYVSSRTAYPLVVVGEPGVGKSAVMAKAAEVLSAAHPTAVVSRFIGATPASSDDRAMLADLHHEVAGRFRNGGRPEARQPPAPAAYEELVDELSGLFALASAERPMIVLVDAVDQLSETAQARGLPWIPAMLPEHAHMVVSTSPGRSLDVLRVRLPSESFITLDPMVREEGAAILSDWLADAGRTLLDHQRDEVLDKFEPKGLPLYLRLAFEEARRWRSFTPRQKTVLELGVTEIIHGGLLARLAEEDHGELLVSRSLGYLAAANHGLAEDELVGVLSSDRLVMRAVHTRSPKAPKVAELPIVLWARLRHDLEPYLREQAADGRLLLGFSHEQLADVIKDNFLTDARRRRHHRNLARYFAREYRASVAAPAFPADLHVLAELPYQQAMAGFWGQLHTTLTDFRFLEQKAVGFGAVETIDVAGRPTRIHTGVFLLQGDFALAMARLRGAERPPRPVIVTAVATDGGFQVRCPSCLQLAPVPAGQLGGLIRCPQEGCRRPLRVNEFALEHPDSPEPDSHRWASHGRVTD
jgi:hypothetical protein